MAAKFPPAGLRRLALPSALSPGLRESIVPPEHGGKGRGPEGDRATERLRVHAEPCPGVRGNTHGLPGGLHTTLFLTLSAGAASGGVETSLERPPLSCWALPGGSVSRRRVEVSLSLSLHSHRGGAFFPYFIQRFHVNCKPRFYRGS